MTFLIKRIKTIYILKNKRGEKNLRSKAHRVKNSTEMN